MSILDICTHSQVTAKSTVMELMRVIDSDGVVSRRSHRLTRRQYHADGPNYIVHIDGYAELRPFGFDIPKSIVMMMC